MGTLSLVFLRSCCSQSLYVDIVMPGLAGGAWSAADAAVVTAAVSADTAVCFVPR